ncbi:hypothetical protein CLV49_0201 [Labedella gwakjiensis]|uniref:Uncharacterized protein n=1 Tax=Labedella gwakjiensis TaxID=390269 RepID=A0A2P8GRN2_9MICO|nr:hypothetical protein [Labedella gwakjiensis]PSL36605.1 hypothetical protein CLV49_0201 [Labedella gwakjiensis]RUQ85489.1 hypothetical protein ELQ93_00070 [Labedella gwakjiensis]
MSEPVTEVQERSWVGVVAVWIAAVLAAVAIGVFVDEGAQFASLGIALAGSVLLTFAIQLAGGVTAGYLTRVAISVAGAVVVLVLCSVVIGIAALFAG